MAFPTFENTSRIIRFSHKTACADARLASQPASKPWNPASQPWNLQQNQQSTGRPASTSASPMAAPCLEGGICCRIVRFICSGACADACWPSGWLRPAWRAESAAESLVLPVLGLTLMLAGLPVGCALPGGRENRRLYNVEGQRREDADSHAPATPS